MKLGQIPENVYNRSVVKEIQYRSNKVSGGAVSGEACAFLMGENDITVVSNNKNASLKELNGTLGIYSAVNELVASGVTLSTVNVNMLMPHRFAEEKLKVVVRDLNAAAEKMCAEIGTFNGEMLNDLTSTVLSVNAVGTINKELYNAITKPKALQDLVLTKWVGMAGTVILADNKREELLTRFSASYIDEAYALNRFLSVHEEAKIVRDINSEAALAGKSATAYGYAVSKGGIYKALWDVASRGGVGLEVNLKDIPIKQETVELCNYFDLNPYELYSEGCMLIACDNGKRIVEALESAEIPACIIGKLTGDNDRVVINDYERKFLTKPCPDELTKIQF